MIERNNNIIVPFTRVGMLLPYVNYLEKIGLPIEKNLLRARLSPDMLQKPDALVPLSLFFRFLNTACYNEGIDHIGLKLGQSVSHS